MTPHLENKLAFAKVVTEEDREQVLDLYHEVWGAEVRADMERIFQWKFESSPFMPRDRFPLLFYRAGGRIVAFLGGVPYAMKFGDRYHTAVCIMDFISHPSYRSKGLWLAYKMALDSEIVFGVSGEENRGEMWRLMAKRHGRQPVTDVGTYQHLVLKLDVRGSPRARKILRFKPLINLGNFLWKGYIALGRTRRFDLEAEGMEVREVDRFGDEINRFWESIKDEYVVIPKRTDAYLNWRFADHPTNRYYRFLLRQRGKVRGYLILRLLDRRGEKYGRIVDVLASRCDDKFYEALIRYALEFFRQEQAAAVQALQSTCPELQRVLRQCGFSHRSTTQRPLALQAWQREDYVPLDLFLDSSNWHFTYGESDGDMSSSN